MFINARIKTALVFSFAILFASCVNSVDEAADEIEEIKTENIEYGLSASIQVEAYGRTAIPKQPTSVTYYIDYVEQSKQNDASSHIVKTNSDSGVFKTSGGSVTGFYIPLANGKWVVEAGIKNSGGTKVLTDKKTIELTPENPVRNNEVFVLKMAQTEGGKGSIRLKVSEGAGVSISTIKIIFENGNYITGTPGTFFEASDIPSGEQKIIINCYNDANTLVYSTNQYINIYDNLTTDQWILDGSEVDELVITSENITDFLPRQYYVDGRRNLPAGEGGNDNNTGTSMDQPFKTIGRAIEVISARPETYAFTIHVRDGSYEVRDTTLALEKSVTIECWRDRPNDRLGSAKLVVRGGDECISVGAATAEVNFYLESLAEDNESGLEINGNGGERTGVKINNGIFVLNGGKITQCFSRGVVMSDNAPVQFIMRKGRISNNKGPEVSGVYVGTNTIFQMEGGEIINNSTTLPDGAAVLNYGDMSLKGIVNISGNTDSAGKNANLYLCFIPDPEDSNRSILNKVNVYGSLMGSTIWLGLPLGQSTITTPTSQTPVAFTNNYVDYVAPSTFFKKDDTECPYVIMKSIAASTYGEASFGLGGGIFYTARDYDFSFASDVSTVDVNTESTITITPTVRRVESRDSQDNPELYSTLYYNSENCKVYLDATYLNSAAENNVLQWNAELSLAGIVLPDAYQPYVKAGDPANKFTIPALPYQETYTLTITVSFMGYEYSMNFNIVCN